MLAEVSASDSFEELEVAFERSPTFYRTLVRLIEKCARAGDMGRLDALFARCTTVGPGLWFCRGLRCFYAGDPQGALDAFNKCKNDPEWGEQSMGIIFRIYANPNRKYVWCETRPLATQKDLTAAEKILGRMEVAPDFGQLQALLYLAKNTEESVEAALEVYKYGEGDDLNATIGKCQCFLRLGRQKEATRLLNGIVHGEASHSTFSIFVEAFLMMTFISFKEGQVDEAEKYVAKAIELNRSCAKAWELKGVLAEKRKEFLVAAEGYKKAWELGGKADLGIGFKLAVNFMRAEDPVEAIKVSRAIFALHPNYPKLKETVFLPCCAMLRP
jgi:tetratricopeptide repeat protein 21B